jgi:hypothetical protein
MWKPPRERPSGSSRGVVRWVLTVTLGEAVGFSVPAITGVAVTGASWGRSATFVAMVLAGSVEGALFGTAQADCLYRWAVLPARRRWIRHQRRRGGRMVAWHAAQHDWSTPDCRDRDHGRHWRAGITDILAARAVFRAS